MRCRSVADCTATAGDMARLESRSTNSFRFDAGINSTLECDQSNCTGVLGRGSAATFISGMLDVSMGNAGTLTCMSAGTCLAALGANSRVTCGASSSCRVTVGPASTVNCAGSCDVECLGDCDVTAAPCAPTCRAGSLRAFDAGVCGCRPMVDAGVLPDAGVPPDAGTDAGTTPDAGAGPDAGLSTDAGRTADAGSSTDGGSMADAGGLVDAGPTDAGVAPADAGSGMGEEANPPGPGWYAVGCQSASTGLLPLALALLMRRRRDGRLTR
jgi:hypothetical protein